MHIIDRLPDIGPHLQSKLNKILFGCLFLYVDKHRDSTTALYLVKPTKIRWMESFQSWKWQN